MKNKRGFTLVELLSAILILAILLSASVLAVTRFVGKSKVESMEAQKRAFVMAGKSYAQDHQNALPSAVGSYKNIYAKDIKGAKYLKKDLTDEDGKSCMSTSFVRVYKYAENTYTYTAFVLCKGETETGLELPGPDVSATIAYDKDPPYVSVHLKGCADASSTATLTSWDYAVVARYRDSGYSTEVYRSESTPLNELEEYSTTIDLSPYEIVGTEADFDVIVTAYNTNHVSKSVSVSKTLCTLIHLDSSSLYILKGESKQITFTSDCAGAPAQWSSSDPSVATVDNGVVTGVDVGNAVITATLPGGITAQATVEIGACTSISLTPNSLSLRRGEFGNLTASKDCPKEVQWSSSDPSVATVDNGVVTAVGAGNAVITGTLIDGVSTTANVGVCAPSISVSPTSAVVTQGGTTSLTVDKQCTDSDVTWTSSDPSVATVEDGVITGVSTGEAVITASVDDVSSTVNVNVPTCSYLTLDTNSLTLQKGKTREIVVDKDCANPVTWTSSNPSVVTVENGVLTGAADGNAVITATLMDGITATVNVNVCTPTISVSPASVSVGEGSTKKVTATTTCTTSAVTWKSNSTSTATVTQAGVIKGINRGSTTVTASVDGVSAKVSVSVTMNWYVIG